MNGKKKLSKIWQLFMIGGLLSLIGLFAGNNSKIVHADQLSMQVGETGNVYYDTNNIYTLSGTKNGQAWSDETAAMAVSPDSGSGDKIVFCIAPGVPFFNTNNPGYEAVDISQLQQDVQIASVIWNTHFGFGASPSGADRITTQAVIWELLPQYGIRVDAISGIPDFQAKKQRLYDGIAAYKRLPEFNQQTVNLKFGETTTLSSSVDLNSFETMVGNTAKVNWVVSPDGHSVAVTPTDPMVQKGTIAFKRSYMQGTPIALAKTGSQTVYLPSVKDPANYVVNFDVKTTGEAQIKKVDKETGVAVPDTKFIVEFSGQNAPETKTVVTDANGIASIGEIMHGVHVKATEVNVPKPYVLGSAVGEADVVEGDVVADQTITLIQKNMKEKGQIIVEKTGVESGTNLWNQLYSLAGNVFEIRKENQDGEIIQTITTDEHGHAETTRDLPLGTYVVVEKTASTGFVNTFKPVVVKIEYANQTTAVVVKGAEGKNQEVTGTTVLKKFDMETGSQTQGRATFKGAEYALYHEDGTPVKWSERYRPRLVTGTKLDGDSIVVRIDDDNQEAGIEHLALGTYYWQEVKAPEGYQIDSKKHEVVLSYKDQYTQNILTKQESKEKVIKFSIDGFKYLDSKSGNSKSGYNDITFSLTPIQPTKGAVRSVTTHTDEHGYDGYWKFESIPYGDYVLKEVNTPKGYQSIKELIINSSFDSEKRVYTFKVTEKGQKEAIKILNVPESKINQGSNIVYLSKLFLTNSVKELPIIRTKATVDGNKTFEPSKQTMMKDTVTMNQLEVGQKYTNAIKLWRVVKDDYQHATVVWEGKQDFEAKAEKMEQVIQQMVDTSNDDETISYVFTEELFEKDGPKVAEHTDLTNKEQTIKPVNPFVPTIETLFVTNNGDKTFDPTKNQQLVDKVKVSVAKSDIGKTFYYVTQFFKISKDGESTLLGTDTSEHVAKEVNFSFEAIFEYKANMLKDGEKIVATHIAYKDKEHKEIYAKHVDLTNEKQTLTAVTPKQPMTPNKPTDTRTNYVQTRVIPQMSGKLVNGHAILWLMVSLGLGSLGYAVLRKKLKK